MSQSLFLIKSHAGWNTSTSAHFFPCTGFPDTGWLLKLLVSVSCSLFHVDYDEGSTRSISTQVTVLVVLSLRRELTVSAEDSVKLDVILPIGSNTLSTYIGSR